MKIVEYKNSTNIKIEFQDKYKAKVYTVYSAFKKGEVKNPYHPNVYGVGMIGNKHPTNINGKQTKEYNIWREMLYRCSNKNLKEKHPTYKDAICCEEWLLYENFYEWLHSQENFDKWLKGDRWNLDKDILIKNNKVYCPETCCLVPHNVNNLFIKSDATRGKLPIGVSKHKHGFQVNCNNPFTNTQKYLGIYKTIKKAFLVYKHYKEDVVKQMAKIEYSKGNITRQCYEAMMNYVVEITD